MAVRLEDGEVKFTDGKEFTSSTLTEKGYRKC